MKREQVVVGVSPLAELMACLHVLAEPDHHPEVHSWVTRVRSTIDDGLRTDLLRFAPLWARYRLRLFFPSAPTLDRGIGDEIEALAALDDDVFLPLNANAIRGRPMGFRSASEVLSDRVWVSRCDSRSFYRGDLAHSLVADPAGYRRALIDVLLRCCARFFDAEWARTAPRLRSTSDSIAAQIQDESVVEAVASLSPIASTRGSSTTVFFDKLQSAQVDVGDRPLLLIPSTRSFPHVMIKHDAGLPVVIQFPSQGVLQEGKSQSQQEITNRLAVLAEPGRWALCRHLLNESITTSELALRTGTTSAAVSRHLRILREAGLVSSQKEGRQVFHRLTASTILRLGSDALRALVR